MEAVDFSTEIRFWFKKWGNVTLGEKQHPDTQHYKKGNAAKVMRWVRKSKCLQLETPRGGKAKIILRQRNERTFKAGPSGFAQFLMVPQLEAVHGCSQFS